MPTDHPLWPGPGLAAAAELHNERYALSARIEAATVTFLTKVS
jgi:hypothetical protein